MPFTLPNWLSRGAEAIRHFATERPWTLLLILLAMNAVARPLSVTAHDARLYSLQALNAATQGAYADDVFLRYGSQDQYSLFSRIVGPIVAHLGVRLTFFCCYFVFNTLFIVAIFRLVRALIDDAAIATLALVFLVTAPLPYGGHDVFVVQEQFFTPRTIAVALTLFALERLFRERFLTGFALLLVSGAVHPLMALGGVMIGIGLLAATYLSQRICLTLLTAATVIGLSIVSVPTLGTALFGTMDDEWHHQVRVTCPYSYPVTWTLLDWLNAAVSFAMILAAVTTLFHDEPRRRRFFIVVGIAGAVGFLATVIASMSPYALLFQAQTYRVMWILKVLQIPLGFMLIACWSQSPSIVARLAALGLVAFFSNTHAYQPEWIIIAMVLPLSIFHAKMTAPTPQSDWFWYGAARGFVLGALCWMIYRQGFLAMNRGMLFQHFDFNQFVMIDIISPMVWLVGMCFAAGRSWLDTRSLAWSAAVAAAVVPGGLFIAEASPEFRRNHTRLGADIAFLREVVKQGEIRHPTIYAAFSRSELLWIDVGANSYFDIVQTAGVIFNRRTAMETERRALLVAKFEMQQIAEKGVFCTDATKAAMEEMFRIPFASSATTHTDLVALCQDESLDYVVIPQAFPGLYTATNGRVYVYDCARVRAIANTSFSVCAESR